MTQSKNIESTSLGLSRPRVLSKTYDTRLDRSPELISPRLLLVVVVQYKKPSPLEDKPSQRQTAPRRHCTFSRSMNVKRCIVLTNCRNQHHRVPTHRTPRPWHFGRSRRDHFIFMLIPQRPLKSYPEWCSPKPSSVRRWCAADHPGF